MRSLNNHESTGRQANPWLTLLLVVATVIVGCFLPGWWYARNALVLEAVGAFVSIAVFAIYTAIYGGVRCVFRDRGLMTVLMVAGPWLFAVVNVWGRVVPFVLTTSAAFTGLLAALSIGVTEELIFRGILFRGFQGRSMALYVLVSSIIFGLVHYQQGYEGVVVTAVVGSSYSLARVAGTPLSWLIVCHAVTDFPTLFSHTPHSQYRQVAFGAVVGALGLAVAFFSRRANWRTQGGESLPAF
jgi:membrane protease YdiL (CAAX protease family)